MGGIFYLIGAALVAYAGFNHFQWYFIFISTSIMLIGYFIIRAPQINGIVANDGIGSIMKILPIQIVIYSILTGPIYVVASILN